MVCDGLVWVGVERMVGVFSVGNVHVHNFGSLDSGCRRRGSGMVRVCRYLKVIWVVKGLSGARCQGRDTFGGRGRCARVLAGKGAAK